MKKPNQTLIIFTITCLFTIIGSVVNLQAQCGFEYIHVTPSMYHYEDGEDQPDATWDIANLADDQDIVINGGGLPPGDDERWSDEKKIGYIDFGSPQEISIIDIVVKWSPSGTLRFSSGLPDDKVPFLEINFDELPNRPKYPDAGIFRGIFGKITTRYVTMERLDGFNDASEVLFANRRNLNISGHIANECGTPIPHVDVSAESDQGEIFTTVSNENGDYTIKDIPCGRSWTITASRDDTDVCGVDQEDLDQIVNHIFEIDYLNSPYALLAADANGDENIITSDIVRIRQLIQGILTDFSTVGGQNWQFIDPDFNFSDPLNPFEEDYPTSLSTGVLNNDLENQNFIAAKTGDVDCSYDPDCDEHFAPSGGGSEHIEVKVADSKTVSTQINPNPFFEQTTLNINVAKEGPVEVAVYDLLGNKVEALSHRRLYTQGTHYLPLDFASLIPGIYLCVIQQNGQQETLKLIKTR